MLARALREIHAGPTQAHCSAGVGVTATGDTGARAGPEGKGHRTWVQDSGPPRRTAGDGFLKLCHL
jgi:hypothetical protein